ncbi:DUF732 domain-containing protein [Pseudonocardia benzenivorans]|uniref:DUF732 domain-containing protein n=1 Tax=Pseudonocardia benzenivorans TaxID=228005 RepID=A0ABW3VBQ7_9PSEU
MGGIGALILLAVIVGLVTGSPAPTTTAAAPTPTTNPPPALQRTPEQAFVGDILNTPGLTSTMSESDMIGIGRGACEVMAYQQFSRADLIAQLGQSKYGPQVMEVFVDAAHRNLCPQYAFPSVTTGGAVATAAAPPASSSTANTVSNGTYLVGEDLTAGTWKTPGGSGGRPATGLA